MNLKRAIQLVVIVALASIQVVKGQSPAPLFQTNTPLHVRANTKIKYIKKNLNDSIYTARKIIMKMVRDGGIQLRSACSFMDTSDEKIVSFLRQK